MKHYGIAEKSRNTGNCRKAESGRKAESSRAVERMKTGRIRIIDRLKESNKIKESGKIRKSGKIMEISKIRKISKIKESGFAAVILLLALMMAVSGCGKKKEEGTAMQDTIISAAGTITLYHVQGHSVEADQERFQLKQPDSLSASVEEVASALKLPEGITFVSFSIDADKVIHLTFSVKDEVQEETRLLSKLAVVRSLNGLSDARNYVIALTTEGGDLIEEAPYSEKSFYYYETGD